MSAKGIPRRIRTGDARDRAAEVLLRVELDGAFAAPALNAALEREPGLIPVERALATELVYGVLRSAPALDARLGKYAGRPGSIEALDPFARAALRVGAYQILALGRVPVHAAVNAAVEAVKRERSPKLGGFVNALLRKLAAERPAELPEDARLELAMASLPRAVVRAVGAVVGGEEEARRVLRAALGMRPAVGVRAQPGRASREELEARLREELPGAELERGRVSPLGVRVLHGAGLEKCAAWREGLFSVQEEGAQCVALAAGVRQGDRVLDACAGRGGKTGLLAGLLGGSGVLHAVDLYPEKIERVAGEVARLGGGAGGAEVVTAAADLSRGLGGLAKVVPEGGYDVVLVDAPCSGLGTLGRRPELLRRPARGVASEDDEGEAVGERVELPVLQRAILERVAPLVKVGGVLVYAVCTLSADEGPGVEARFLSEHPEFVPAEGGVGVPERLRGAAVLLRPDLDGTDGFMIRRWVRKS